MSSIILLEIYFLIFLFFKQFNFELNLVILTINLTVFSFTRFKLFKNKINSRKGTNDHHHDQTIRVHLRKDEK